MDSAFSFLSFRIPKVKTVSISLLSDSTSSTESTRVVSIKQKIRNCPLTTRPGQRGMGRVTSSYVPEF